MAFYDKAVRGIGSLISPKTQQRNLGSAAMASRDSTTYALKHAMKTVDQLIGEGQIPAEHRDVLLMKLMKEIEENARMLSQAGPVDSIELSKKALATVLGGAAVAGGTAGVALDKMRDAGWGESAANFLMDWGPLPRGMGFEGGPSKYQNQMEGETEAMQQIPEFGRRAGRGMEGETEALQQIPEQQGIGSLRRLRR